MQHSKNNYNKQERWLLGSVVVTARPTGRHCTALEALSRSHRFFFGCLFYRQPEGILSCQHYPNASPSRSHRSHQSLQKSMTTANRMFSPWNSQAPRERAPESSIVGDSGNVTRTADSAVRRSASTRAQHSTTCNHRHRAEAISCGIWCYLASSAMALKRIGPSNSGRKISYTVLSRLSISSSVLPKGHFVLLEKHRRLLAFLPGLAMLGRGFWVLPDVLQFGTLPKDIRRTTIFTYAMRGFYVSN